MTFQRVELYAPEAYWALSPQEKSRYTNGCGVLGLVPDSLLGCDIREACNIHDYMWRTGTTHEDMVEGNRVFLNNMLRLVEAHASCKDPDGFWRAALALLTTWKCRLLRGIRRHMAVGYYNAVTDLGGPVYWAGKNPSENTKTVPLVS